MAGGMLFAWWQHDTMMRQQYELQLIDTEPHIVATFDRYDPGGRGETSRAWVYADGELKELTELWGVANLNPGQSLLVVISRTWPESVVPVYAREELARYLSLYPRILSEEEMFGYQLTMPLTWRAGGIVGVAVAVFAVLFDRSWNRRLAVSPTPSVYADDQQPGWAAGEAVSQGSRRRPGLGLGSLALAAFVVFAVVATVNADVANPWGLTAAAVWFVVLTSTGINNLLRRPSQAVTKATNIGFMIGCLIVMGWALALPEGFVGSRMPTVDAVRLGGLAAGALGILVGWPVLTRLRARSMRQPGILPSTAILPPTASPAAFKFTRRNGYDTADVDRLLARIAALPETPEGRNEALALLKKTRFHLAKGHGYEPRRIDQHIDQLTAKYAGELDSPQLDPPPEEPS
ncbi:MAG: hypothetical protein KKA41_17795 [Proteobacteria bacterium]|nr:hypothetical protein [Pseudomonadota bacterium]